MRTEVFPRKFDVKAGAAALLAFAPALIGAPALSQRLALTSADLRPAFAGTTIHVDAPFGNVVKVVYGPRGQLDGDAGGLSFVLGSQTGKGRWWIEKGMLCHRWERWLDAERNCLTLSREGQRIFWQREDGESGTATIVSQTAPVEIPSPEAPRPQPAYALAGPSLPAKAVQAPKPDAQPPTIVEKPVIPAQVPSRRTVSRLAFRVKGVAFNDVLNVREGPSQAHSITSTIAPNARGLRLTGPCRNEWCPITYRGRLGWVGGHYLERDALSVVQR